MNVIEYTIENLKRDVKRLEHDYKQLLDDASYRNSYPYSEMGISHTLEGIANRAFELMVCNKCDNFHKCDHMLLCMESIDGSADMAKEYGDRCYDAALERLRNC